VRPYAREFLRIVALVAITAPLAALLVAYFRTGSMPDSLAAIDLSWSKVIGMVIICAIVAALPSRKSSR
jgi:hypothetical protein